MQHLLTYHLDEVDLRRYQAIESVVERLHDLLDNYRSSSYVCPRNKDLSFPCGSFLLGALTKELNEWSLLHPRPQLPFEDLSFNGICAKLRKVKSPSWSSGNRYGGYNYCHDCELHTAMQSLVEQATSKAVGLSSAEIRRSKKMP